MAALLDTIDEAVEQGESLDRDTLIDQIDSLIRTVVRVCEGPEEEQIVDALLRLRDDLSGRRDLGDEREVILKRSYGQVAGLVNEYFQARLYLLPEIVEYLESLAE